MSFWVAVILSAAAGLSILAAAYGLFMPVKVLAPKMDIRAGSVIGENDIGYLTISRKNMHSLAVTNPGQVVGKYARDRLYSMEPILSVKLTSDQRDLTGVSGNLARDETYITFKPNEAKWPNGLKSGDSVAVVAVVDGGIPRVIGERIKVLNVAGQKTATGQLDQIKSAVSSNDNSITLSMKWAQIGPLFYGKTLSKEIWIMPEHPAKDPGGDIYDPVQLEQIRKEIFNENSAAKRNTKTPKPVS